MNCEKTAPANESNKVSPASNAGNSSLVIQRKLSIGAVNDPLEHEANAMADKVMRMPEQSFIQRKCAQCEEEEKAQRKPLTSFLQKKEAGTESSTASNALTWQIQSTRGSGNSLQKTTRSFMENRFEADFSNVRVHNDSTASQLSNELNAEAFTIGNDIYFNKGKYAPESQEGKHLLAHELTHTIQQNRGDESIRQKEQFIQRRLIIRPGNVPSTAGKTTPFTAAVQSLLTETCPTGGITVNPASGVVSAKQAFCEWHPPLLPGRTQANISDTPVGCQCLCDIINNTETTTVEFVAGAAPATVPNVVGGVPRGFAGTGTGSPAVPVDPRFQGQYRINGKWVDIPFYLILAHELCGHALPFMTGTQVPIGRGPVGGVPPHERTSVDVERQIAAEHNPPLPLRPEDYSGDARQRP